MGFLSGICRKTWPDFLIWIKHCTSTFIYKFSQCKVQYCNMMINFDSIFAIFAMKSTKFFLMFTTRVFKKWRGFRSYITLYLFENYSSQISLRITNSFSALCPMMVDMKFPPVLSADFPLSWIIYDPTHDLALFQYDFRKSGYYHTFTI